MNANEKMPQEQVQLPVEQSNWRRFEILQAENEAALEKLLKRKKLNRADLFLILTVIRIRPGCEDTFESCYPELESRLGWKKDPQ